MGQQPVPVPTPTPPPIPAWVDAMWAPTPPTPPRRGRGLLWAVLALGAMLCLAGAGVSYWWTQRGPDHPDEWDPRVVDLVAFVEEERGAHFQHPVTVNFLDAEQYAEVTSMPAEGPDEEQLSLAEDQVAMFRALGLMSGEVDLLSSSEDLFGAGTAAFYDSLTEQVYVNSPAGESLSVSAAATVVHELTHVHQDQIAGLGDALLDDESSTTDRHDAHLAIVEGDATVVEESYLASRTDAELDAYAEEWGALADEAQAAIDAAEVPGAMDLLFQVPYSLGPAYVLFADAVGDRAEIDAALGGDVPPSVVVLDLLTGGRPEVVRPEVPAHDGEELDVDTVGAMTWLVVLGGASTPDQALAAASTWRGDRFVQYRDGRDRVCIAATVAVSDELHGEPVAAGSTFGEAAQRWAVTLPPEADASAVTSDDEVQLRSCDPGAGVEIAAASSQGAADAVGYASLLNTITAQVVAAGAELDAARCYGRGMLERFGLNRLSDDVELFESDEFTGAATTVAAACDVPGG